MFDRPKTGIKAAYWPVYAAWIVMLAAALLSAKAAAVGDVRIKKSFSDFPSRINEWKAFNVRGSAFLAGALNADDVFLRVYADRAGNAMELYMAYFGHVEPQKGPHAPQLCWVGLGWQLKDGGILSIDLPGEGARKAIVKKIRATNSGKKIVMYYCYWINGKYFVDMTRYRLQVVLDTLFLRKNDSFTMQLSVPIVKEDEENSCRRAEEFIKRVMGTVSSDFLP
jgi:EpsI family protein